MLRKLGFEKKEESEKQIYLSSGALVTNMTEDQRKTLARKVIKPNRPTKKGALQRGKEMSK